MITNIFYLIIYQCGFLVLVNKFNIYTVTAAYAFEDLGAFSNLCKQGGFGVCFIRMFYKFSGQSLLWTTTVVHDRPSHKYKLYT